MEALVEFNYVAQEPDELTIRKGDIIKDVKIMSEGWWEGTLRDKRGMFPDNFVKVLEPTGGVKSEVSLEVKKESATLRNGSTSKWCKVLFSYDPCNEDELALAPNDMVEYLGQVEEGWWTGRLRGRVGVFPSNFVSAPAPAEDTKEMCLVLFSYKAANEDELTLAEGEIVTLISRDAPDKGWWKGELRGKIGLFPDNFVKIIQGKKSPHQEEVNKSTNTSTSTSTSTSSKLWNTGKKGEKAYARKSLDTRTANADRKSVSPISPVLGSSSSSSSTLPEKKASSSPISPGIKRLTKCEDVSPSQVDSGDHNEGIDEELDGVEREEDTPLLHLTASRVKAPRRRLPSSHHRQTSTENSITNGAIDTVDQSRNDDPETGSGKNRQPVPPWIEELKFNQKKILSTDKPDKAEVKKEKNHLHENHSPVQNSEATEQFQEPGFQELQRLQNKDTSSGYQRSNSHLAGPVSPISGTPAYVPYRLYSQLLERIATLEERQTVLQRMVVQLSEQVGPLLTNLPGNKS
ncbi:GSCOCG00007335001-RA-CDS [Cotesia congregata]|nr:GSCOCG00007335001-RA-CDS [Cotesia congregata]